jgi:hypothetical protein
VIEARKLASILSQIPRNPTETSKEQPSFDPRLTTASEKELTQESLIENSANKRVLFQAGKPPISVNQPAAVRGDAQPAVLGDTCLSKSSLVTRSKLTNPLTNK